MKGIKMNSKEERIFVLQLMKDCGDATKEEIKELEKLKNERRPNV